MGRLSNAQLDQLSIWGSKKSGGKVPPSLIRAVIMSESGGNPNARSPAGAQGLMQLMPSHGVRNPYDPRSNVLAGVNYLASMLQKFGGSKALALSAYNSGPGGSESSGRIESFPETQKYVHQVLQSEEGYMNLEKQLNMPVGSPVDLGAPLSSTSVGQAFGDGGKALTPMQQAIQESGPSKTTQNILQKLGGTAGLAAREAAKPIPMRGQAADASLTGAEDGVVDGLSPLPGPGIMGDVSEWVTESAGADRPGVHTNPAVLNLVGRIAQRYGSPLTIGTGTNHSKMTVNGNVSDHWDGYAADIPATGQKLRQMGYAALVTAGMSPKAARAAARKGGLFNVGGYQIIFATHIGGDHTNHMHVGIQH